MATGETLREWRKANQYRLAVDFNRNSEDDKPLIEKLEEQENKAGYVKGLIRSDIERLMERHKEWGLDAVPVAVASFGEPTVDEGQDEERESDFPLPEYF